MKPNDINVTKSEAYQFQRIRRMWKRDLGELQRSENHVKRQLASCAHPADVRASLKRQLDQCHQWQSHLRYLLHVFMPERKRLRKRRIRPTAAEREQADREREAREKCSYD
jgi:hypothetical protein